MRCPCVIRIVVVLIFFGDIASAQDDLLDEPRPLEQITFSPPTSASIRLQNGVRRTGKIVSISRESMVYQVGRDNNEVTVEIGDIQRVNTLDREFSYEPERESFERLKIKARRISYLHVETVQTYVPPPEGVSLDNNSRPAVPEPTSETAPGGTPRVEEPVGTTEPSEPPSLDVPDDEPQPGQLILFCSGCDGRLPLSVKNGDVCPHCGLVLYNIGAPAPQRTSQPANAANGVDSPFGDGAAAFPNVPDNQAGEGGNIVAAPPANPVGGGQVTARGFDLNQVPVWMKVGFFVGMLAIGWLLLQRR